MLKLVVIIAPEDVKQKVRDLVLTEEQKDEIEKIMKAIQHREYLREIGLHDIGKLLFVGVITSYSIHYTKLYER